MATHYVNNAEMLEAIKQYRAEIQLAKTEGREQPRIPEYIGECILKIATRLSHKINFINYSYREDMILDGIENCMMCIQSFDPDKSSNPFSYFTQVIYFAFLRRIAKEKKQAYIKGRLIQEMAFESFDIQDHDDDADFKNAYTSFIQSHQNFDDSFIKKKEKVKTKKEKQSLETFFDVDASEQATDIADIIDDLDQY
jgi:hypothetical protein